MATKREPFFRLNEELEIEPAAGCPGFHSFIVGIKTEQCLILDHPFSDSHVHQIRANDAIWVRFTRKSVYRFRTRVMRIIIDPIPLLFLSYPQTIQEVKRREGERKKVFLRATTSDLKTRGRQWSNEGYILDISRSGCLMWGDFGHLVDQSIHLTFTVPWSGSEIGIPAKVVRCEATEEGFRAGVQFVDLDPKKTAELEDFVKFLNESMINRLIPSRQLIRRRCHEIKMVRNEKGDFSGPSISDAEYPIFNFQVVKKGHCLTWKLVIEN
jgi:c-di-GMP-binding flagellar brake protein YcgR